MMAGKFIGYCSMKISIKVLFAWLLAISMQNSGPFVENIEFSIRSGTCLVNELVVLSTENVRHSIQSCSEKNGNQENGVNWFNEIHDDEPLAQKRVHSEKPEYKVRDSDICVPGRETVNGCTSNTDQFRCNDESYPIVRQLISTEKGKSGEVLQQFSLCPEDPPNTINPKSDESPEKRRVVITPERFRNYPILASNIKSSPQNFSLRNGFTHFWASENKQTFTSNLSGHSVRIRAIPVQWIWNYGDGTNRRFDFPGEAVPNHTLHDETSTSHVYEETGKFKVVVTTLYRGEFSVDGGPWERIPGQASVPSDPVVMDVWRTKKELIATD